MVCQQPLAEGAVGYAPGSERWTPHGWPVGSSVTDSSGHLLTWGGVRNAHATLTAHASCDSNGGVAAGYESDEDAGGEGPRPCPCQWHPVLIETLDEHRADCARWPGPICGVCWAASCECGFVFDDVSDAAGRDADGRFVCASPSCRARLA